MNKLMGIFAMLGLVCFGAHPAEAAKTYTFKLAHNLPAPESSYDKAAVFFKERLEKHTNGRATVNIYPAAQLGSDVNIAKKLQNGSFDFEIISTNKLGAFFPPIDLYSLPFLFPDFDAVAKVVKSEQHKKLMADMEKKAGFKSLAFIGSGFRKDAAELEKLLAFADDETVLDELTAVKKANKEALADWLLRTQKVQVNSSALFDIQSKRLHEYKRQQLNLLYLIHQYHEIKAGHLPAVPLVSIFGAKAAPAYTIAKDIIHALLTLSKVIAADPEVSKWLQVVFVENYNVTAAEKLIPACDLSEQISLASKEASGTGNMKFMLNGALTLGTMDGANVEISQQVGDENIYIFGQTSDQVIHRYAVGDYDPAQWVEGDANIRRAIGFLTGPEMLAAGHAENLTRLHDELIRKDWFQTLPDFNAYVVRKGQALSDYACDPLGWCKKCLVNIAKAGFFSSDRTIAEYDRDIWHLGQ